MPNSTIDSEEFMALMNAFRSADYRHAYEAYSAVCSNIDKASAERGRRIVAATVEACKKVCDEYDSRVAFDRAADGYHRAAANNIGALICEISPEQILSGLAASQQPDDRIADSGITIDAQSREKQ